MSEMPNAVRRFAWLTGTSLLLVVAALLVSPAAAPLVRKLRISSTLELEFDGTSILVMVVIVAFLLWLAVAQRRAWARNTLGVLFLLSLPGLFLDPYMLRQDHLLATLAVWLATLLQGMALAAAFSRAATPWFLR